MPSSYLITGGAGFIGSSIARALLTRGDKVRVLDNFFSGKRENRLAAEGYDDRARPERAERSCADELERELALEDLQLDVWERTLHEW